MPIPAIRPSHGPLPSSVSSLAVAVATFVTAGAVTVASALTGAELGASETGAADATGAATVNA